ncbi:MetQ/NlpA family ABC transporter substrate-binding protein [Brevibacterium moorei]|uniref:MetQ/NlpA family ABC transporter substrate-binding protein n=1 Tax=Brevibacterium moorei TaxID=2968457 RepID=UPI00211CD571|nr:MetQ/NlpA family ABC transporter substrate-binding protein [Brevibacterium sp. 68QC2CO]MCQ9386882.1 MetQ/NlpA family ABC transporter substrate-binding protein [Brevibacterium sp. 68QC2CO]
MSIRKNHTTSPTQSHAQPRGKKRTPVRLALGTVAAGLALALSACGGAAKANDDSKVVIGTDSGTEEYFQLLKSKLKDEGIDLEVKNFTDGVQINNATQNGDVDINLFQHIAFLSQFNVKNGGDLVPVGATAVYPLPLYSKKYSNLDQLPKDATIALPSNPTNQARALLNLQAAGLLKLKGGGNSLSTPAQIESSSLKIKPVDTNQTVNALAGGADAAVVNNTQAQKGGLTSDQIIYQEDLGSHVGDAYINAFVVKAENKDDERWKKITDAYHSPEIEESVRKLNGGALEFKADWTQEKLQKLLDHEEEVAKQG